MSLKGPKVNSNSLPVQIFPSPIVEHIFLQPTPNFGSGPIDQYGERLEKIFNSIN